MVGDGFTALHFAAYLGGVDAVRVLLEAGPDCSAVAPNDMRVQPLHSAAALGDVEASRALLDAGSDPNAEQQSGFRPLDEALLTENSPLADFCVNTAEPSPGTRSPADQPAPAQRFSIITARRFSVPL